MVFGTPGPAPTPRLITRDLSSLNVFTMSRANALADGAVSFWRLDGGEAVAMARGTSGALIISVANGPAQIVEIEFVPGTRGGSWPQFKCPLCGARRHHLFVGNVLACRSCHRLAYSSRHTARPAMQRVTRLRMRLADPRRLAGNRRRRMIELLEAAESKAFTKLADRLKAAEYRARSVKR